MKPIYSVLIVFVVMMTSATFSFAQCTDSVRLAPDSLQWVFTGNNDAAPSMARYQDTLYVGGRFTYVGKYTGSCIGLNSSTLEVVDQNSWPKTDGYVRAVVPDGNGGMIIAGEFNKVGDSLRQNLAQVNASGQVTALDVKVNKVIFGAVVENDILYIGGEFTAVNGSPRVILASIDLSTGQLTSWNPDVSSGRVWSLVSDGTDVFVGGEFEKIDNITRTRLASFNLSTGNLTNWNPGAGQGSFETVRTLHRHGNTLYVGGDFTKLGGSTRNNIGAFDLTTGNLKGWAPNFNLGVHSIKAQNGKVYVGGNFTGKLAAVDSATGSIAPWSPGIFGYVNALALSGSTLYVGGSYSEIGGVRRNNFAAVDISNGALLNMKANTNLYDSGDVYCLNNIGGTIYVGGEFTSIGGEDRINLAAIDIKNNKLLDLNIDINPAPQVTAIKIDGARLYIAGGFTSLRDPSGLLGMGSIARKHLASFDITNSYALTAWNPLDTFTIPQFSFSPLELEVHGNNVYVGGQLSVTLNGTKLQALIRMNKNTGVVDTWKPTFFAPLFGDPLVTDLELVGDRLYIAGSFGSQSIPALGNLMYYDLLTGNQAYGLFNNQVNAIAKSNTKVFAGGVFTGYTSITRNKLSALDTAANGGLLSWQADVQGGSVATLARHGNKLYIGGYFTSVNGADRLSLAVADTADGTLWPWNPSVDGNITDILPMGDTVFIAGNYRRVDGRKILGITRFHFDNYTMPQVSITPSAYEVCDGTAVTFIATSNMSSATYKWKVNGNTVIGAGGMAYSYIPQDGDSVSCEITVSSTTLCLTANEAVSNGVVIKVNPVIKSNISISGPAMAGKWAVVNLTATVGSAGSNYNIEWINNGTSFANTNTPAISYTKGAGTDNITAILSSVGCYDADTATLIVQENVGINDVNKPADISIYPNPVEKMLHINGLTRGATISIIDVAGRQIYTAVAQSELAVIDTKETPAGSYILKVTETNGKRTVKPIVKK